MKSLLRPVKQDKSFLTVLTVTHVHQLLGKYTNAVMDEGPITTGHDVLQMNMTSSALNVWTKFCSQDKNRLSLRNLCELPKKNLI